MMEFYHLDDFDMEVLGDTFKLDRSEWGDYDRFLDGLTSGMTRQSKILHNYGLGELNKDALTTITKHHGFDHEVIEDIIFVKKGKGHR